MLIAVRILLTLYAIIGIAIMLSANKTLITVIENKMYEYSFSVRFLIVIIVSILIAVFWPMFLKIRITKKEKKQ